MVLALVQLIYLIVDNTDLSCFMKEKFTFLELTEKMIKEKLKQWCLILLIT